MKIYSADTWTIDELREQMRDAGRHSLVIPPGDSKRAVLETFGAALDFPEHYGANLDALNDSLHDFADAITDAGQEPITLIWQVAEAFRTSQAFALICEILQDAEKDSGNELAVTAIFL